MMECKIAKPTDIARAREARRGTGGGSEAHMLLSYWENSSRSLRWAKSSGCIIRWCNRCVERALTDGPLVA